MVILLLGISSVVAQENDTYLYRFISVKGDEGSPNSTQVLFHDVKQNVAVLRDITRRTLDENKDYGDTFIIIPIEEKPGEVLIASAKKPEYLLKRGNLILSGERQELVTFEKNNNAKNNNAFRWHIVLQKEGNINAENEANIVSIQSSVVRRFYIRSTHNRVFGSFSGGRVEFLLERGRNTDNTSINGTLEKREVNDDYRFVLQRITNTF